MPSCDDISPINHSGQTETLYSFTIVTTSANKEFEWLHERQPVMLSTTEALNTWLDTTNHPWDSEIVGLMHPYHDVEVPLQWRVLTCNTFGPT